MKYVKFIKSYEDKHQEFDKGAVQEFPDDTADRFIYQEKVAEEISEKEAKEHWYLTEYVKKTNKSKEKKNIHPHQPTTTHIHPTQPNSTQEEERKYKIKTALLKERPKFAQLKCGIHKDVFYFGTILPVEDKTRQAVVTSNRDVYVDWPGKDNNEIKKLFGLNYAFDFDYNALDSHWSVKGINKWYEGVESKTLKELYEEIKFNNSTFMWYPDSTTHKVVALDILSSYFLPCFEAKGRIFLEAEKGSGKTRQSTMYKLMGFNSVMSADITKSAFFRIMESTCGTLIIDDFDDNINDEQKKDVLQHYKTGYKNTSKSVRTGEGVKRKSESFRNYGHCVMNNTTGLDPISAERSIYLPILRTDRDVTKLEIKEHDVSWQELRDDLFICALTYWKDVRSAYSNVKSELKARQFEITRPVLALANLISNDLFKEVEGWLVDRFEENDFVDFENDWSYLGLKYFESKKDDDNVLLKDIAEYLVAIEVSPENKDFSRKVRGCTSYLGKFYRRFPSIFKMIKVHGINHVKLLSSKNLFDYAKMKGWNWVELGVPISVKEQKVLDVEEIDM